MHSNNHLYNRNLNWRDNEPEVKRTRPVERMVRDIILNGTENPNSNVFKDFKEVCNTERDFISDEDYTSDSVQIYNRKRDIGKSNMAECYLKSTLKRWFSRQNDPDNFGNIPPYITQWTEEKRPTNKRVYKLPISGSWIDGLSAKLLVCSKYRVFVVMREKNVPIGSQFGISNLHGSYEKVKTLTPLDRINGNHILNCNIQETTDDIPERLRYIETVKNKNISCYVDDIDSGDILNLEGATGCVMMFRKKKKSKNRKKSKKKRRKSKTKKKASS
jgi:hypothetical protein